MSDDHADAVLSHVLALYPELLSPAETAAHRRRALAQRAGAGDSSAEVQARVCSYPGNRRLFPDACGDDPQVIALAADGMLSFKRRTAERLLREHGAELQLPGADGPDGHAAGESAA
jgi:hypothetical protein